MDTSSVAKASLLTTASVAKRLDVTPQWVRALARVGQLPFEATESGQRLFRRRDVLELAAKRMDALARSRPAELRLVRRQQLTASVQPRQLKLRALFRSPFQVVARGERAVSHAKVKRLRSLAI